VNPDLRNVADHMRQLGLGSLRHAMRLSLYYDYDNGMWGELSVLMAAHAAEILIKARIAQEDPLLIFEKLPKRSTDGTAFLELEAMFEKGRTLRFEELPGRLRAATGFALPELDAFKKFGRTRNSIQHLGVPKNIDPCQESLAFIFTVVDPFINSQWGLFAIDYNEEMGDHYEHIFETLVDRDLRPLISPDAAQAWTSLGYKPGPNAPQGYGKWYEGAIKVALAAER
jgi:hypothetical protein